MSRSRAGAVTSVFMQQPSAASSRWGWVHTLKFKIVTMAVVTGILSTLVTTQLLLNSTKSDMVRLRVQGDKQDVESTAALLSSKITILTHSLSAVANSVPPALWHSPEAMHAFLVDKPGVNVLFESVLAARADGVTLARVLDDKSTPVLPNIGDRAYFQQTLKTGQLVISEPVLGKISKAPMVVIGVPVLGRKGAVAGVLLGTLPLRSGSLFAEVSKNTHNDGLRTMIMNRTGVLLTHPNVDRVMGSAAAEPGLASMFTQWRSAGSPLEGGDVATVSDGHVVVMVRIPNSEWMLVHLTPESVALAPVKSAQRHAWIAAVGIGLLVALLAGALSWYLIRPISVLRARANRMLTGNHPSNEDWPQEGGEVGELSLAFQRVIALRQQKQAETQGLLLQLEAVLDHADVGISFTRNNHFELVSRQFCRMFQFDKQDILGHSTDAIYPSAEAYEALSKRAHPAFLQHGTFEGEVQLMRRTGEVFWALMRGRAVLPGDRSQGTIWTVLDITETREHRERLAWTSSHDSLTGLTNRSAFEALLSRATDHAATEPFCAMFIDLDYFKQVNDTGGHAAGDALLRDASHTLVAQVRQTDTVARLGGDEFAVLLPRCPLPQALEIGEKLRSAVVDYRLAWEGQSFGVGASIGLVVVDATYTTAADVLRAADVACYVAKQRGRNCVAVYDPLVRLDALK